VSYGGQAHAKVDVGKPARRWTASKADAAKVDGSVIDFIS
jgi:hypothetical protein